MSLSIGVVVNGEAREIVLQCGFCRPGQIMGLLLDGGRIVEARLALGGVAARPWRVREAEDALRGRTADGASSAVAAAAALRRQRAFLDTLAAKRHPGVVEVMTPAHKPALRQHPDKKSHARLRARPAAGRPGPVHQPAGRGGGRRDPGGRHGGRVAAHPPRHEAEPARTMLEAEPWFVPSMVGPTGEKPEAGFGDAETGLRSAARRIDVGFSTPPQFHNPLEPHAVVASWDGTS